MTESGMIARLTLTKLNRYLLVKQIAVAKDGFAAMNIANKALAGRSCPEWEKAKFGIMRELLFAKAQSCPEFEQKLLDVRL